MSPQKGHADHWRWQECACDALSDLDQRFHFCIMLNVLDLRLRCAWAFSWHSLWSRKWSDIYLITRDKMEESATNQRRVPSSQPLTSCSAWPLREFHADCSLFGANLSWCASSSDWKHWRAVSKLCQSDQDVLRPFYFSEPRWLGCGSSESSVEVSQEVK